jgi:hypothetical protein
MPKVTSSVQNFTNGELSPRALGRFDLSKFNNSAKTIENFFLNQLGGVSYRPGTRYVASTKSDGAARLFPFQYSSDQDYVVEAGEDYFRLYSNGADIIEQTVNLTKLLLSHDHSVDSSTEFLDSGNTGHVVTSVGTSQMSTAQKKFGSGSLLLDGDSDYLTVPDHANFDLVADTTNYTVEFWVKHTDHAGVEIYMEQRQGANDRWTIFHSHGNGLDFDVKTTAGGSIISLAAAGEITDSAWHHIALIKTSTTYSLYKDGTRVATVTDASTANYAGTLYIGAEGAPDNYFNGYMDEVRIYQGNPLGAASATTCTLPTSAHTSDASTHLLLNCDSQDASVSYHRTQFKGTAVLDTDVKKFGTASLLVDGDSDYLQIPDHVNFDIVKSPDDNWTLDLWVKHADHVGTETYIVQWEDANNYWLLQHVHGSGLRFIVVSASATIITTGFGGEITDNTTFHHIAVCKKGNEYGLYKDGTQVAYVRDSSTDTLAGDLYIGATGAPGDYFQGSIDDVRLINSNAFSAAPNITNTDTIVIPTSAHTASASSQTEISTPYGVVDIFQLQMTQSNDVMYIVHPDFAPRKLSRTGASAFTLSLVSFSRPPLMDTNTTAVTITPSADTGAGITLTASASTFTADNVGGFYRVKEGIVKITAFTSVTVVTGDVQAEPDGSAGDLNTGPGAVTDWAEGAFSERRGWPSAIAFHEQRLFYANTTTEPQKVWASYISAFDSFDATATTDDYAVTFAVATDQRNAIRWINSNKNFLSIGTTGGTFSARGNADEVITPTGILIERDTNYGVANLQPKRISSFLYYIQRDLQKLRELSFFFDNDAIRSQDMTLLANHILSDGDGVVQIDHQQSPNDRIWVVRDDGELAALTRNPEQDVMGWVRIVAGTDSVQAGKFESVAVIPKSEEDDQVWVIVNRTVGGSTKRFIEFFTTEEFDDDWDAIRVDSSLTLDVPITITGATKAEPVVVTAASHGFSNGDQVKIDNVVGMTELNGLYFLVANKTDDTFELQTLASVDIDGAAYSTYISGGEVRKMVTAITGLDHLEGETVSVQTDGSIPSTETYTVSAGGITLSQAAAVVHAGLPYTGTLRLLKLSDGSAIGTGQTKNRRIYLAALRVYRSLGIRIGRDSSNLDTVIAHAFDSDNFPPDLVTGDREKLPGKLGWGKEDEIVIIQSKPLPLNLLAVILRSEVQDKL